MIRILVVDDVEAVRAGVAAFLASVPGVVVVGLCSDGCDAEVAVQDLGPDVVLMDVRMAGLDGISATAAVLARSPAVRVVILSSAVDGHTVHRARAAGAVGYVLKSDDPEDLLGAVAAAAAGGQWWCPPAAEALRHAN